MTEDPGRRPPGLWREAAPVLAASLAVRGAFIWFKGPRAYSIDLEAWRQVGVLLARGGNPYAPPSVFFWPPLWVQILWVLQKIGAATGISLTLLVPIFLIAAESALILVLVWVLRGLGYARRRRLVLFGIILNPVCIVLVCQHGNFDVLVGLVVLIFVAFLLRYERRRLPEDWLLACLSLGAAIALKNVPAVLLPLLLAGGRELSARLRVLGAALSLGPAAYALSILQVLHAGDVKRILGYRSIPGWFGATGWLHQLGHDHWMGAYRAAFTPVLSIVCIAVAVAAYNNRLATPRRLVASAAFLLCFVVGLGPGYGSQYFYWFWPLLLVSFPLGTVVLRRILLCFGVIAATTYATEYALSPFLGAFLSMRFPATRNFLFGDYPPVWRVYILVRTPLWLGYLALLWGLLREMRLAATAAEARPIGPDESRNLLADAL